MIQPPSDPARIHLKRWKNNLSCSKHILAEAVDYTHCSLVPSFGKCLFISNITFLPAVGDHVTGNGWMVDNQGAVPAHHQCCLVQWLDLHAHWGTTAHWKTREEKGRIKEQPKKDYKGGQKALRHYSLCKCSGVETKGYGWENYCLHVFVSVDVYGQNASCLLTSLLLPSDIALI